MPQTATQRNRKSEAALKKMPQPATKVDAAETEDSVYGLVSVLYHALQGAQACDKYINDAESAGDSELVTFFTECREAQTERASRAKQLLVERTEDESGDESDGDDDDDDDDDSDSEGEDD